MTEKGSGLPMQTREAPLSSFSEETRTVELVWTTGAQVRRMDWWEGQDIDPDSGMNHITKAITSLVVLRDAMHQGKWTDDRPPPSKPFYPELNRLAGEIIDRYADRNPTHYTKENT